MDQVEVWKFTREAIRVGKAGAVIGGGVTGNRHCGIDGVAQRLRRQVGARCMAALLADVNRDPDALVAVVFNGFNFTLTRSDGLSETFADFSVGCSGAAGFGMGQRVAYELFERVVGIGKRIGGHDFCGAQGPALQERAVS